MEFSKKFKSLQISMVQDSLNPNITLGRRRMRGGEGRLADLDVMSDDDLDASVQYIGTEGPKENSENDGASYVRRSRGVDR